MPTPHGTIYVKWRKDNDGTKLQYSYSLPDGVRLKEQRGNPEKQKNRLISNQSVFLLLYQTILSASSQMSFSVSGQPRHGSVIDFP